MFRSLKMSFLVLLLSTAVSYAQLAANPWVVQEPSPNDGYFGDNVGQNTNGGDIVNAPIYAGNSSGGEILPVDPWARARDTSGIRTWRGSGQQGKLNYVGEGTFFNTGDLEMLAPEVNRHNMVVMLDHLRKMGYKIPESYDEKVKNMPANYRAKLRSSMDQVQDSNDPFSRMFTGLLGSIESATGLSVDNILFNTVDILGTD